MLNKEFQELLKNYPDDMPIKLLVSSGSRNPNKENVIEFNNENIMLTSEQAFIDTEADPETWDSEDGKITQKGKQFLLLNPIIV